MSETGGCPDTFSISEMEIYKHPLVQSLLDALPQPLSKTPWSFTFPITKRIEDEGKIIIAGYASVEVIDSQNELIPIPVLKEAWEKFEANSYFATGSLMHSNIPVIRILEEYKDSKGQLWKSGVDDTGLFIVAEVRNDIEKGKQTIELIKAGKLTGFSIGGEALQSSIVCEGKTYTRIDKMELHEIAVVDRPANQPSVFTIVKSERIHKLEELTALLPNLIISPGVVKLAGSVAELGEGHDFDLLITAAKGSFIDRAAQTRIHNELRKIGREDLWSNLHLIHESEGLGPFTEHLDLYDLVLIRSNREKMKMVKRSWAVEDHELDREGIDRCIGVKVINLGKAISMLEKENIKKLSEEQIRDKVKELIGRRHSLSNQLYPTPEPTKLSAEQQESSRVELELLDVEIQALRDALGESLVGKSIKKLDAALSQLRLNGRTITS